MTTQLSNSAEPTLSSRIAAFLANPVVDKTIAVIACLPFLYVLYQKLQAGTLDVVRTNMAIHNLIIVATMLARRAPVWFLAADPEYAAYMKRVRWLPWI